jgi:osmotically-inducible protein OsmY
MRNSLALAALSICLSSAILAQLPQSSAPPLPDQNEPTTKEHHGQMSTKDVKEKLDKALDNKNVAYAGSDIKVAVDDQSVTLSGGVQSSMQREMAMQLARAYAGNRKVVNQLSIR